MRRPIAIALVAGLLVGVAPVAAHGNYVAADAQVSDDGTVRLELVVAVTDAFVVLRADDGGRPGAVVGHRTVGDGFVHPSMSVGIDASRWANLTGNATVWAVLHWDTGDGVFDVDDDPALETASGDLVGTRFTVRKATASEYVVAEGEHAQETNTSQVTVRRVRLARPGYVVVRSDENGTTGHAVGHTRLPAGTHRDVPVEIDDAFYRDRPERFDLWAAVHRSDGDGAFDPAADRPIAAGDDPVASRFSVKRTDDVEAHGDGEHEHDDGEDHEGGREPHTATPAATPASTAESTPAATPTRTAEPTPTPAPTTASTPAPGQPGFGVVVAVAALVVAALAAKRRSG